MASAITVNLLSFDAAYLEALHRGDPETEHHFFQYFTPLIRAKLRKYLRAPELVEEGIQETFARVLVAVRKRDGVRHPERFGGFVHAVCRNVALEMLRSERRFVALEDPDSNGEAEVMERGRGPFRSPHGMLEAAEACERVRKVLAELSPFDRQLLIEVFLDEQDRGQVCRRLGVSRAHLRILLFRARKRFLELTPVVGGASVDKFRSQDGRRKAARRKALQAIPGGKATPLPI
ncbi:MAG: RNA polymerase sigma factor [Actinomycetota bacterium]